MQEYRHKNKNKMVKQKVKKVTVAMRMNTLTPLLLAAFGKHVVSSMTGNVYFTTPSPTLAAINTAIASLEAAISVAKRGDTASTSDMHAKKKVLHDLLKLLGAYIEGVANLDPANAATIAKSSGAGIKNDPKPRPSGFRLQLPGLPGEVKLFTTAVKSAVYKWQYTTNPADPTTWVTYAEASIAHILVTGLTSGQRYYFRVAAITKAVGPWSTVINTVVM